MLQVIEKEGQLVVDSRLIAEELGIEHHALKQNIRNYLPQLEAFGKVAFEMTPSNVSNQTETVYFLNEDQAILIMTLSRNTEKVVQAKVNLVKAFSLAKATLFAIKQEAQQTLNQTILAEVLTKLESLTIDKQKIDQLQAEKDQFIKEQQEFDRAANENPGCADILLDTIENEGIDDISVTALQFLEAKGISLRYRRKITLAAANFQRIGKNTNDIPRENGQLLLEVRYLRQAARTVLGL